MSKIKERFFKMLVCMVLFFTMVMNVNATENTNQEDETLNYLYVESSYLETPNTENVVISLGNGDENISKVLLVCVKEDGTQMVWQNKDREDELYLFSREFSAEDGGTYKFSHIKYVRDGIECVIDLEEVQIQAEFGVNVEYSGYVPNSDDNTSETVVDEEDIEIAVASLNDGDVTAAISKIEDTLEATAGSVSENNMKSTSNKKARTTTRSEREFVVVLDPGHGGSDPGAQNKTYGVNEDDLCLKIAQYARIELEKYENVRVFLTRESDVSISLKERVDIAKNKGADLFVSMHLNAYNTKADGAEVYYPNSNYNQAIGTQGKDLAQKVQEEIVKLGLDDRGIKIKTDSSQTYPNGSLRDYYAVIRYSKEAGFPGIIIENAFIDNNSDYLNYLSSEAKLKNLGVADATGIAKYLQLSKKSEVIPGTVVSGINYVTHVQDYGWQNWKANGVISGTVGESKRLEAIQIKLADMGIDGSVEYSTHVQDYGWQNWKQEGKTSGTSGESKRLEAIKIRLTGDMANSYDVYYRVHVQDYGWLDWAMNGEETGSTGLSLRLEGIQIQLVAKGDSAPGSRENILLESLEYRTHVQDIGWQSYIENGNISGTIGLAKRLEAINIRLGNQPYDGSIQYCTHVQDYGWQSWKEDDEMAGTSGQSKRLEAIKIKLTGTLSEKYDVYYRVHVQDYGWLGWAKNGTVAGTTGRAKRLESIQIQLSPKGSIAPGSTLRSSY